MKFLRSKRGIAALVSVLLVLFLFRPGVYGLRHRIAASIGAALGRRVELDNVRIHVLPQPAFDLEGLVIYDDPAFSSEPMVRAQDVAANIRLRSLLRGRLEIARLSATEPSINLVRNREGRWNLANLLERNAHIPVAPTGKAPSEHRPAFPYLEATHARINFKIEQEKKPYALTDADVALWQESENSWGARMRAEPVRTDFNLTDTGLVSLNAIWQRAPDLRSTPVQVSVRWEKGQLGQITKLLSGKDRGWRGGVDLSASLSGTPEALQIQTQASITDFHRYDLMGGDSVLLSANCAGRYSVARGAVTDLNCEAPVKNGTLTMTGTVGPIAGGVNYDLTLAADKVPLTSVLHVLRHAKKQLPSDLTATGLVRADIHAARTAFGQASVAGDGIAANVRVFKNGGQDEIVFGNIPLSFVSAPVVQAKSRSMTANGDQQPRPQIIIGNFPLAMGGVAPATAGGWISTAGYNFALTGDAAIKNLFRLADTVGIVGARPAAQGSAKVALNLSGSWQGFAAPTISGTAQLHNVRAEIRGMNPPIEIAGAFVTLKPEEVSFEKLIAQTGTTHWSGKLSAPRNCVGDCVFRFDLAADRLSTIDLQDWFVARAAKRSWYQVLNLGGQAGPSPLLAARAAGNLRIAKFEIKKLLATQVATQVDLDRGRIGLNHLRARLLQGTHQGTWVIDAAAQPVKYQATGVLQNISLVQVSGLMNDAWVTGTGDAKFEATATGLSWAELLANANATVHFSIRDGNLPHIESTTSAGSLSVHKLAGDLLLDKGTWELSEARLESHDGIYQVAGRASAKSGLNFTLLRNDDRSWTLFGTLAKPRLERTSRTQAQATVAAKP